jgi:hypothetical protein
MVSMLAVKCTDGGPVSPNVAERYFYRFAISHLDIIYYLTSKFRTVDLCLSLKFASFCRPLVRILLSHAAASVHVHTSGWAVFCFVFLVTCQVAGCGLVVGLLHWNSKRLSHNLKAWQLLARSDQTWFRYVIKMMFCVLRWKALLNFFKQCPLFF